MGYGPSSTGGWTKGGGHSRVARYYGLGAHHVLSARVILASGDVVVADLCNNTDLSYAIRGGGSGTYDVTQMTLKTYPTKNTNVIDVTVNDNPINADSSSRLLYAMTYTYCPFPYLSRVGFGGCGGWALNSSGPIGGGNFTTLYTQSLVNLEQDSSETTLLFASVATKINPLSKAGFDKSITQEALSDFGTYFNKNLEASAVSGFSTLSSRLLGKSALDVSCAELQQVMEMVAEADGKTVYNILVHHGLEEPPVVRDKTAAVQPGWYNSVVLDIFERPILVESIEAELLVDMRQNILPIYQKLSPNTGRLHERSGLGRR
ncbi:hypothetical protein LX32DRAFT_701506 [Colletotrichum zoysiae]|uniref:FAD-binding PCMH-type domain-containing protein n=1 Tax=Colletotrichum zoysiae TaxID=1216348 RepID=A0AAD9HCT6_9PEZI|nr:hypothetical protein LX32DRAFT_701506 [Colletotrichum zoysiae]